MYCTSNQLLEYSLVLFQSGHCTSKPSFWGWSEEIAPIPSSVSVSVSVSASACGCGCGCRKLKVIILASNLSIYYTNLLAGYEFWWELQVIYNVNMHHITLSTTFWWKK